MMLAALLAVLMMSVVCLFIGSSGMSVMDCLRALFHEGTPAQERIIWRIRIPRVLAAIIAGAGLSLSGLVMQTALDNQMASPSTLGVTNAAVFGANLSIIVFAGGQLTTGGNPLNMPFGANPYSTSLMAFLFSTASVLLILALCRTRRFSPGVVVLAGIAMGSVWTAATTILQYNATDVGLSAAVVWSFGDLARATYRTDAIMAIVLVLALVFLLLMSWRLNAMLSGEAEARSLGVNAAALRFSSLMVASLVTAVCISFLGSIGFVGIICPHVTKKLLGQDHRHAIPMSALSGSLLLLVADTLSRSLGNGTALPVGAITSLLGAPFFLALILSKRGDRRC